MSGDYSRLPEDLPMRRDDGAADGLVGRTLPALSLPSTQGGEARLAALAVRTVVAYVYPMTGTATVLDSIAIETYDLAVAEARATLLAHVRRAGTPRGPHHLIIAATALARDRQVVTLDRGGFADLPGVTVVDPA